MFRPVRGAGQGLAGEGGCTVKWEAGDVIGRGQSRLQLTPAGLRALRDFTRDSATPSDVPGAQGFIDGEGLECAFVAMAAKDTYQRFVAFAGVPAGCAVIEVGAGTGRLTFAGGLAAAVGPLGVVLATDPAPALLRVLARKRSEHGTDQVHILAAPAERLPVADARADLVLGIKFLHYCDAPAAVAEMVRTVRPGGVVAVLDGLPVDWDPGWAPVLAPLRAAAAAYPPPGSRQFTLPPGESARLLRAAGLEGVEVLQADERAECSLYEVLVRALAQSAFFESFVTCVPEQGRRNELIDGAYGRVRTMFQETPPAERGYTYHWTFVRGRRPR